MRILRAESRREIARLLARSVMNVFLLLLLLPFLALPLLTGARLPGSESVTKRHPGGSESVCYLPPTGNELRTNMQRTGNERGFSRNPGAGGPYLPCPIT